MVKTVRCVVCRSEFTDDEIKDAIQCPQCGDQGIPMSISEDVEVKVNWHELRILCIWARNFAESISGHTTGALNAVNSITNHLSHYRPPGAAALSVNEECQEIANALDTNIVVCKGGNVTVHNPKKGN